MFHFGRFLTVHCLRKFYILQTENDKNLEKSGLVTIKNFKFKEKNRNCCFCFIENSPNICFLFLEGNKISTSRVKIPKFECFLKIQAFLK